jgi:hypothetical protein
MPDTETYRVGSGIRMTRTDFEQVIDSQYVRSLRLLFVVIPLGPMVFAAALGVMSQMWTDMEPRRSEIELIGMMSVFHAVFALIALLVSEMAFRTLMNVRRIRTVADESTHVLAVHCANKFRMASIVRFAILEIAAMIGLGICAIGATRGVMNVEPMYWVNLFSTLIMVAVATWKFPSQERVIQTLQESCNQQ